MPTVILSPQGSGKRIQGCWAYRELEDREKEWAENIEKVMAEGSRKWAGTVSQALSKREDLRLAFASDCSRQAEIFLSGFEEFLAAMNDWICENTASEISRAIDFSGRSNDIYPGFYQDVSTLALFYPSYGKDINAEKYLSVIEEEMACYIEDVRILLEPCRTELQTGLRAAFQLPGF